MATSSRIAQRVEWLTTDIVQADHPMMAELDANLAAQTEALAFRCSGNRVCHNYPSLINESNQRGAPRASLTAVGAYSDFSVAVSSLTTPVGYPWRLSESYRGVAALVTLMSDQPSSFELCLETRSMVDAVATTTGESVLVIPCMPFIDTGIIWANGTGNKSYRYAYGTVRVPSPTLPAAGTRRFLVVPKVKLSDTVNPGFDVSCSFRVYIKAISIWDYPAEEVGW